MTVPKRAMLRKISDPMVKMENTVLKGCTKDKESIMEANSDLEGYENF